MELLIRINKNVIYIFTVFVLLLMCNKIDSNKEKNSSNTSSLSDSSDYELEFYSNRANQTVLEQNLYAVNIMQESQRPYNNLIKDSLLHEAKKVLEKVVENERNFYKAYVNLSIVFIQLKEYDKAIYTLENLIQIKDYPLGLFYLGILYEKQNRTKKANSIYFRAMDAYSNYMKTSLATIHDEKTRDILYILLYGKEKAISKIEKEIENNPDDSTLMIDKEFILNFDREKFINSF